ncbi:MAG TPA: hypothetical protein VKS60_26280 [Stellaceae bacterium]|nr:hypothetical protein [Stellaceae bacterium]
MLADLTISDATAGAIFGLTETDTGITEVVTEYPDLYSPSSHFTMNIPSTMFSAIDAGLQRALHALERLTGEGPPAINIYTQAPLELPGRNPHDPPLFGDANFGNGLPKHPDGTIHLSALSMGIVLAGTTNAEIVGHAANEFAPRELLIGNAGDDTIRGGGGSGSIFSGSGSNEIHTGGGNMLVGSGGTDTIWTGAGYDIVQAYGSATVHAGAGKTVFSDLGTASSHDRVHGGSGRTVMESGLGQDTFIGGSGTSKMIDTGNGHVAFQFNRGAGGNDIVKGFDAAMGDYIRAVPSISFGAKQILGHETVSGGSTFVSLWDGTRIEFVGVTNLTAADFHS